MTSYVRIKRESGHAYAQIDGDRARILSGAPWLAAERSGETLPLDGLELACPVEPSKILGVGRNYRAHIKELGHPTPAEPLLFLKAPSALLGPGGTVLLPPESSRVDHEGELGVVIGRRCRRVSREHALEVVFGYVIVCDVTARDLQEKDGQWSRSKSFDGFCPVGPRIVTDVDPAALGIRVEVNGAVRQNGTTRDMIFGVPDLIAHASAAMTLEPGDLIATGTPEGVGPLAAGDHVVITIDGLGALEFAVAVEGARGLGVRG